MSDTQTTPASPVQGDTTTGSAVIEQSDGTTTIADGVVAKIATLAAREVEGVSRMGDAIQGAIGGLVGRIRGEGHSTGGVSVEVGTTQVAVDLAVKVVYPQPAHKVAQQVRERIRTRMQDMTGLEVVEVNVSVLDYDFPGEEGSDDEASGTSSSA